jgi:hypothetical protein
VCRLDTPFYSSYILYQWLAYNFNAALALAFLIFLWLAKKKNSHISIEKRPGEEEKTVIGIKINEEYRLSKKKKSRSGVLFMCGNTREKKNIIRKKDEKEGGAGKQIQQVKKKETCKAAKKESNKIRINRICRLVAVLWRSRVIKCG